MYRSFLCFHSFWLPNPLRGMGAVGEKLPLRICQSARISSVNVIFQRVFQIWHIKVIIYIATLSIRGELTGILALDEEAKRCFKVFPHTGFFNWGCRKSQKVCICSNGFEWVQVFVPYMHQADRHFGVCIRSTILHKLLVLAASSSGRLLVQLPKLPAAQRHKQAEIDNGVRYTRQDKHVFI